MARHIVASTSDIPPGGNKVVGVDGRDIVVFHVNGEFFALLNRCPHEGAPLDKAVCIARLTSPEPGVYQRSRELQNLRALPGAHRLCGVTSGVTSATASARTR